MIGDGGLNGFRKNGDPVLRAFTISDDDLVHFKVDVFDSQAEAFHCPKTSAEQELGHNFLGRGHGVDDFQAFIAGQDRGQAGRFFGADGLDWAEVNTQDFPVEKQQRVKRLVLSGGGHVEIDRQMGEKCFNFRPPHVFWVLFVVEQDEAFNPGNISVFGADGIMPYADGVSDLIEQFFGLGHIAEVRKKIFLKKTLFFLA